MQKTANEPASLVGLPFLKMNGLGNDFVILDGRNQPITVGPAAARSIADRAKGVGFDQLIVLEPSAEADVFMRILNADGSQAGACGNATRCVGRLIMDETGRPRVSIETAFGLLAAKDAGAWNRVSADMGRPGLGWRDIPLAKQVDDTGRVPFDGSGIDAALPGHFSAISMGNPHAVFFVNGLAFHDLKRIGPLIETHPLFPERANVSLAEVVSRHEIRQAVWERGAGITLACGSAACAAVVAGARAGLTERSIATRMPGGTLDMHWRDDGHVIMTGAIMLDYKSVLTAGMLGLAAA